MKLLNGRVLFALLFVVIFAILLVTATGYNPSARLFPLIVSIPVFLGAVVNLVFEARATLRGEKVAKGGTSSAEISAAHAVAVAREKVAAAPTLEKVAATPALEMATAGGAVLPPIQSPPTPTPFEVGTLPVEVVKPEKKKKDKLSGAAKRRRELIGAAWVIGYVLAIALFGFPLATIGYMIAFIRFYNHESWKLTIVYTAVLFGFVWIAFVVLLKSNLYPGLLFEMLGR
jgi:hypothetical protein